MKPKKILVGALLLFAFGATAQNNDFSQFARVQDSLMMKAYYDKKPDVFVKEQATFENRYQQLPDTEKKNYLGYHFNSYYNLACTYSLLGDKKKALETFKKSVEEGYTDYAHLLTDTDLDPIRNENEFKKIIQPLRETGDYLYILKKAGQYNVSEKQELPAFTYQASANPNLVTLRKAFNLDSIAGEASEVSKILNLLHWVHNLIPHDGNHGNPVVKNALSMIRECKKDVRGLNCRGLATVLNECYLAMGIPSRFVTCLPKDSLGVDPDCHVINMVYSRQLKKWLWIDPTFDAYIMNEKGEMLGMEEVRERIINDQPLILNPEANWNNKVTQTKANYLYSYMAKNLYMLECPISSEYDTETQQDGKTISYLRLIPLDYFRKSIEKGSSTNNVTKTTMITYRTNNPAAFWQAPPDNNPGTNK